MPINKHGLIYVNNKADDNQILWSVEKVAMDGHIDPKTAKKWIELHRKDKSTYWMSPFNQTRLASHDNLTSLMSLMLITGEISMLEDVDVLAHTKHPRDLLYKRVLLGSEWAKYPLAAVMFFSFIKKYKYRVQNGEKIRFLHTDGKLLSYVRITFGMPRFMGNFTRLINWRMNSEFGWFKTFSTYFPKNHIMWVTAYKKWSK